MPRLVKTTACLGLITIWGATASAQDRPNIVVILADDLGYGDVRCYNPGGRIATPRIDRLAAEGMRFTDAHTGSSVCTPTRYGLLTGRYAWRTRLKNGVLGGYSPHLIDPSRPTIASILKAKGYRTACVGKWHLGMDWAKTKEAALKDAPDAKADLGPPVDYTRKVANGPTAVGFDESFIIAASLDMPPYIYLRNDRCEGLPTAERTYIRKGPAHPDFEAAAVLPTLTCEAIGFIERAGAGGDPFFLYLPLTAPHTPIVPTPEYRGKSGLGDYGDFVIQVDEAVGRVVDALDRLGLAKNTLLIFTSDNGCSPAAGFDELVKKGHQPSGPFRGHKADIFEGGHRVPFIARWPGRVKPGTECADTICLTDLTSTTAAIVGASIPENGAEDSVSFLPDLMGKATGPAREATVHHSINGSFAIRQGDWKLVFCPDSGGWSAPRPGSPGAKNLPALQLFHLKEDPAERRNVHAEHPDVVARLRSLMERYVAEGRSTPGPHRTNDREVAFERP